MSNINDLKPFELNWLLKSPAFGRADNDGARQMRNDKSADWMESVFNRIYSGRDSVEDVKAAPNLGGINTVESMVEDLRARVGLQGLEKKAAKIPLSKTAEKSSAQVLNEMQQYLATYCLRPAHGLTQVESLYNSLKEKFGPDEVQKQGRDAVIEMIQKVKKQAEEPSLTDALPKYDGSPVSKKDEKDQGENYLDQSSNLAGK